MNTKEYMVIYDVVDKFNSWFNLVKLVSKSNN